MVTAAAFVFLYEVTMPDSQYAARLTMLRETTAMPAPGVRLAYTATAYCKGATTTSGVAAQKGIAAADPQLLPVGSVVEVESADGRYSGIYTIMDTGPLVQGRMIDLYIWSCDEAMRFGRRPIRIVVVRLGWNPLATTRVPDLLPSRPIVPPVNDLSH